jgi:hypothetical protein
MRKYFIGYIKSVLKKQVNQADLKIPVYLSSEQSKKYVVGNVIVWMLTLFFIGGGLIETSKNVPEIHIFNGLIYAFIGTSIHLIYITVKNKHWTSAKIKITYRHNFVGALVILVIVFISNISRINLDTSPVIAWLELVVLAIIFMMYVNSKKLTNHVFAIYSLIPIAPVFIFGSNGSTMIWAFGFLVSAKSILINKVINPESTKST